MAALAAVLQAGAAQALPLQSWNGYHWARTGELDIKVANNLSDGWQPYLANAVAAWSAAPNLGYTVAAPSGDPTACAPVFGRAVICSANYGANGWLGYTNVWTSGGFVVESVTRLNDYYFSRATYDTPAWRQATVCHELGHALGLAHADTIRTNANIGSCLDYTNDPSGTLGKNGTIADIAPGANDYAALAAIYAKTDGSQLASTKPGSMLMAAGDGYYVNAAGAVPEPATWAMLVGGFGLTGAAARRRRQAVA